MVNKQTITSVCTTCLSICRVEHLGVVARLANIVLNTIIDFYYKKFISSNNLFVANRMENLNTEKDYYNDLPGKLPPEMMMIDPADGIRSQPDARRILAQVLFSGMACFQCYTKKILQRVHNSNVLLVVPSASSILIPNLRTQNQTY